MATGQLTLSSRDRTLLVKRDPGAWRRLAAKVERNPELAHRLKLRFNLSRGVRPWSAGALPSESLAPQVIEFLTH